MNKMQTTLLLIVKDANILLAEKKRGFGVGKLNGIGGKVEPNETIEEAMIRETNEEIGVTPVCYEKMATITFDEWFKGEKTRIEMSVFIANDYKGEIIETEEMKPSWFSLNNIPYDRMFADDSYWLPEILKGNKLIADFCLDEEFQIVSYNLNVIE